MPYCFFLPNRITYLMLMTFRTNPWMPLVLLAGTLWMLMPAFVAAQASPEEAPAVVGQWKTIDDDSGEPRSIVELYLEGDELKGRVVEIFDPPAPNPVCKACDGPRQGEPIEGMVILEGMTRDGDEWSGGRILDPENGKTYRCKLWVEDGELKVRGYVAFFHRTQTWLPAD